MIKEHDKGLCDLRIYGRGMSISLDVEPGIPVATPEKPVAHTLGKFLRFELLRAEGVLYDQLSCRPNDYFLYPTQRSSAPRPRSTA